MERCGTDPGPRNLARDRQNPDGALYRKYRKSAVTIPGDIKSSYYADVSLNQWLALTPPELVKVHLNLDPQALAGLHKEKFPVVPG